MTIKKVLSGVLLAVFAFSASADAATYTWSRSLSLGARGTDVKNLQMFLNMCADTKVSTSGAGSPGMETTYFGPATKAAVIKWQAARGVSPQSGLFGPLSRAKAAQLQDSGNPCAGGSTTTLPIGCTSTAGFSPVTGQSCSGGTTTPQTGPVAASLSATTPASSVVVAGQATADLAHFTFSGSGTVTAVTLNRTGVSANSTLSNVYLYEGATRLTDAASVTSNGTITFSNPSGLFMVSGSKTISVRADILAGTSGQTVGVMLSNYTVMGQTAASMTNLSGNLMSVASATDLATAVLGTTNSVTGNPTVDPGTSNYTVWSNTVQIAQRSVWLKGANFRVVGSAETGALQNARLIVDGAQVGTAVASVTANGTVSFDLSAAPLALNTGSHTIEVRVDVVAGANRSFYLSLQNAGDLMLTDSQYNVNLTLFKTNTSTPFSMDNSATISINSGTLSIAKDTAFNSTTTVTSGASNVTIGKYIVRSYGEAVKVMQVVADVDLNTGTTGLQNVGLYLNGAQVGTSQNLAGFAWTGADDANTDLTFTLNSALIVPAGSSVTLEVRADLQNASGVNYAGTITTDVSIPVGQAQGQSSFALYPTGTPLTTATTVVTAGAASANITKSSGFLNQPVATSAANARVGSYIITAGTTEALRVTNLAVGFHQVLGSATTGDIELTDISNLRATVTVQGQAAMQLNSVNPQATNNFSTDFTVAAGQTAVIDIYVDVTNATSGEVITTTLLATARGAVSNVVLTSGTGIAALVDGQDITVGSGSLINAGGITLVSSQSTSARYVLGASSNEAIVRYSVKPTSGPVTIEELTFSIGGSANLMTALSVSAVGGGASCSVQVPSGASSVTITGCSIPVAYTAGGTDLIVTPTINTVGITGITADDINGATVDLTSVKYNNGSTSVTASLDGVNDDDDLADLAASNAIYPVASAPTLSLAGSNSILSAGEVKVGSVTIGASNSGNINLEALPVTFTLSGGATLDGAVTTNVIVLKEGNTVIATTDNVTTAAASGAGLVTFTNDEIVSAGSSRTFDIYLVTTTVTGGDDAAQISLAPSSSFVWDDINGAGADLVGTYILNYPTTTVTIQD